MGRHFDVQMETVSITFKALVLSILNVQHQLQLNVRTVFVFQS